MDMNKIVLDNSWKPLQRWFQICCAGDLCQQQTCGFKTSSGKWTYMFIICFNFWLPSENEKKTKTSQITVFFLDIACNMFLGFLPTQFNFPKNSLPPWFFSTPWAPRRPPTAPSLRRPWCTRGRAPATAPWPPPLRPRCTPHLGVRPRLRRLVGPYEATPCFCSVFFGKMWSIVGYGWLTEFGQIWGMIFGK